MEEDHHQDGRDIPGCRFRHILSPKCSPLKREILQRRAIHNHVYTGASLVWRLSATGRHRRLPWVQEAHNEDPVRANKIPRSIPKQPWYMNPVISILIGGMLPFGAVLMELFMLASIWLQPLLVVIQTYAARREMSEREPPQPEPSPSATQIPKAPSALPAPTSPALVLAPPSQPSIAQVLASTHPPQSRGSLPSARPSVPSPGSSPEKLDWGSSTMKMAPFPFALQCGCRKSEVCLMQRLRHRRRSRLSLIPSGSQISHLQPSTMLVCGVLGNNSLLCTNLIL
jgi:hypothetical protein